MAETPSYQKWNYPLPVYNFRVTVDSTTLSFTEVTGITVAYDHVTYRHGLSYLEGEQIQTFNRSPYSAITCKRGTILGASPTFLYDWLTKRDLRSMDISLCD